jgi:hypothetical protein
MWMIYEPQGLGNVTPYTQDACYSSGGGFLGGEMTGRGPFLGTKLPER